MMQPPRVWALLLLAAALSARPASGSDGFERFSFREAARQLGIGCGPGYHNRPCCPRDAVQYNKMLTGTRDPGWVNWKRSKLSQRVPSVSTGNYYPGEDGVPLCRACRGTKRAAGPTVPIEKGQTPSLESDRVDDLEAAAQAVVNEPPPLSDREERPPTEARPPERMPDPGHTRERRSIEELLGGLDGDPSVEPEVDQEEAGANPPYVPGTELWKRLGPDTRDLFRREFPDHQVVPGEQPTAPGSRSSSNSGPLGSW